jgi:hypothetical protein
VTSRLIKVKFRTVNTYSAENSTVYNKQKVVEKYPSLNIRLPGGVRRVRGSKLRWEDGVEQDMRISEVKNGRRSPSTETNGQSFLRTGPTKGRRANDDDKH